MLSIGLSITTLRGGGFTPAAIFSAGEAGVWTPDFAPAAGNLWTDTARTTLATQAGDTVRAFRLRTAGADVFATNASGWALAQDASGRWYLQGSGTSGFATSAIDFSASDEMTVCVGVRKTSDAAASVVAELSANTNTNTGAFLVTAPATNGAASYGWTPKGTASAGATATSLASPRTDVLTGLADISSDTSILRVNGTQAGTSAVDQGTGTFGNHALNIGARGGASLFFGGRLYGLVVRGRLSTAAELSALEAWMNARTGAF